MAISSSSSKPASAVFLSYAHEDAATARQITDALRTVGIEVWFDQSELRGGDAWDHNIRQQIKECALFMPIISAHTQARGEGYFRLEWKLAVDRSHLMADDAPFLFPIVIDDTSDAAARVPEKFRERQWTRLGAHDTPESLARRVAAVLREDSAADAPSTKTHTRNVTAASTRTGRAGFPRWLRPILASSVVVILVLAVTMWRRQQNSDPGQHAPRESRAATTMPASPAGELAEHAREITIAGSLTRAQLDTAGELCDRALALDPTDATAWTEAARVDLLLIYPYGYDPSEERRQRAQKRASRAITLAPDSFDARVVQAAVFAHAVGTPALMKQAETTFRELIASHPQDRDLVVQLAEVLRGEKRFEEAAGLFEQIGEFEVAGWSYLLGGQPRAALAAVNRALSVKRAVTALQLKAILQLNAYEDLDAAQATVDQLQPSELLNEMSGAIAASVALDRRDPDRVLALMNALPVDYLNSNAFRGPRQYYTGLAQMLAGRPGAAAVEWRAGLVVVQQKLKSAPDNRTLLVWTAWLQASLGETAEAEHQLARAQDVAGLAHGAVDEDNVGVFLRLGQYDAVLRWLTTVLHARTPRWEAIHADARFNPIYDPLRKDPRIDTLLRETLPEGAKPFPPAKE